MPAITKAQRESIARLVTTLEPLLVGVEIRVVLIALSHLLAGGLAEMGADAAGETFELVADMIKHRMLNLLEDKEQASKRPPGATLQ